MSVFHESHPIAGIRPAPYNPRHIDEGAIMALRESLRTLGVVRPIVVTQSGVTLAGHQRSKAMLAEGITHGPAYLLPDLSTAEEIRFNQLHNGSDLEVCGSPMSVPAGASGFEELGPDAITGVYTSGNASRLQEICRLLTLHGPFGGCVATDDGEILVGAIYAHACRVTGRPALVCRVPTEKRADVLRCFGRGYGEYSYEHLPKTTWAQSLVQMKRLRSDEKGKSRTYELQVIPRLRPGMRVLDFGAGQFDYVDSLRANGVDIRGVEFYRREGGKLAIGQVQRDIDGLCRDLRSRGRYDMVVADSILNSVDSNQAEQDVLLCLSALCKVGGTVVFSGRSREFVDYKEQGLKSAGDTHKRYINFIDRDGASAMYADGVWRYQRFHTVEQVVALARFHGHGNAFNSNGKSLVGHRTQSGWCVVNTNEREYPKAELEAALSREFDLPLPGGRSYGRSLDILASWGST